MSVIVSSSHTDPSTTEEYVASANISQTLADANIATPSKRPSKKVKKKKQNASKCHPNCIVGADDDMIRCLICLVWRHVKCAGKDAEYDGPWTCSECRTLPSTVNSLMAKIDVLTDLISDMTTRETSLSNVYTSREASLNTELRSLKSENGKLKCKLSRADSLNDELKKLLDTTLHQTDADYIPPCPPKRETAQWTTVLTSNRFSGLRIDDDHLDDDHTALIPPNSTPRNPPRSHSPKQSPRLESRPAMQLPPTTVTVVGSSIVRGVAPLVNIGEDFDAVGFVYPGRTARQINARIRHLPKSDVTVLAAGTNNIEKNSVDECKKELHELFDNVARKRANGTVIMSQIPLRYDKPYLNSKIKQVNTYIETETLKRPHWRLLKHELNSSDYSDGLHFNDQGAAKYAHEIRHLIRGIKVKVE